MAKKKKVNWHWKYGNLIILGSSVAIGMKVLSWQAGQEVLVAMGQWGYLGAFFGGMMFVSTFSVVTGMVVLVNLIKHLSMWEIALIAGCGAMAGDVIVFKFVRDGLWEDVKDVYNSVDSRHHLVKLLHTKYFLWMMPVLGALVIVSPLPDELGVSLMGISKMKMKHFLPVSFVLNSIGIFSVVWVAKALGG